MSCYLIFGNLRNRVWSDAYDRIKRQDTAEKVVIGGMMLAYARKSPTNAKRLLDIMHSELREQDLKRVDRAKNELSLIVGNNELANASHNQFAN